MHYKTKKKKPYLTKIKEEKKATYSILNYNIYTEWFVIRGTNFKWR